MMDRKDISLVSVVTQLDNLFEVFNNEFYNGELQKPIITVSPDTTSGAYGWATSWKAWQHDGVEDGLYEINICAEHLNRPFEDICETLLHEMVHLWNLQNDIKDTSRGGKYHNKKYKDSAEQHGLNVQQDSKYGWTITSLNEVAKGVIGKVNGDVFQMHRTKIVKVASKRKSSSRKYVCPMCGLSIRATKEVNIVCGDCQETMKVEE
jgi:hypothetical protein